jgi:hypothetical protein
MSAGSVWWTEAGQTGREAYVMGEEDDGKTQQFAPVQQHPTAFRQGVEQGKVLSPRTFGWAHAFMVVGVTFCLTLLAIVILVIVFADRLPAPVP